MLKKFQIVLSYLITVTMLLISFHVKADTADGLFSEKNFQSLKKDPLTLFSKTNTCQLKSLLGEKDFNSFKETMALMTNEEEAGDFISISGNVRGLFTIMEGFFRMSKSGQIWIAYLENDKVHYFTNHEASLKQPPKIMLNWAERFKTAPWVSKQITIKQNICK